MSQDLLAAFDEPVEPPHFPVPVSEYPLGQTPARYTLERPQTLESVVLDESGTHRVVDTEDGVDEDFGDFEDASVALSSSIPTGHTPFRHPSELDHVGSDSQDSQSPRASHQPSANPTGRVSLEVAKAAPQMYAQKRPKPVPKASLTMEPPPENSQTREIGSHPFAGHMDILFDSENDEYDAGADELGNLSSNPEAAMVYSKRIIQEQQEAKMKLSSKGSISTPFPPKAKSARTQPKDPNVLFDADNVSEHPDDGDADEFGDFEDWNSEAPHNSDPSAQPRASVSKTVPSLDLLSLDDPPAASDPGDARPAPYSPSNYDTDESHTPQARKLQKKYAPLSQQNQEDRWDDFETSKPIAAATSSQTQPKPEEKWDDFELATPIPSSAQPPPRQSQSQPEEHKLPPTNMPPPVILLSAFPKLFSSADEALFATSAKLDLKSRQMLLAHPASHQFLRGYLSHCTVLARIIAGRKLRWKRDQRLSQSMRIGPAAAGGKGGMKLAGLDRSEVAKEDREVVDAVRLYRQQIGKLRTAVTAASAAPGLPALPSVPDIGEVMPVRTLRAAEGGITAAHACALCGLRREERVARVDGEVEDSFGEWWVESMSMHVQCRQFWEEFQGRLKGR